MLKIKDLNMGSNDAENYKRRDSKEFLNKVFFIDANLNRILASNNFFLMGEKGTGKTAYAVYLSNNDYKNTVSTIKYIRETNYWQFIKLKESNNLILSDYTLVWKVIAYLLISEELKRNKCINLSNPLKAVDNYIRLDKAIQSYYNDAFDPEIMCAFEFIKDSSASLDIINSSFGVGANKGSSSKQTKSKFQTNLIQLKQKFEKALNSIKMNKSFILFIDGIDFRPNDISQTDYIEFVKGLTHAVWEINNDFFANIKGQKGNTMKVMMLIRPDIFVKMGLQNQNNKYRDNTVLLDWRTDDTKHRQSNLFKMSDKLLSVQQNDILNEGEAWDNYFPFTFSSNNPNIKGHPFVKILRHSFQRPRDVISLLSIMKNSAISKNPDAKSFTIKDYNDSAADYSNYLLGEIKDQFLFNYTEDEYNIFLSFFKFLNGSTQFYYSLYLSAYQNYIEYVTKNSKVVPSFAETAETFIQLLYELNILGQIDQSVDENHYYWCYRERNYATFDPKIKIDSYYHIHNGLFKALNLGSKKIS